jgi:dethiobiotin synthetase
LAKPNYSFAKRQREIAKKQKKEEKRLRKTGSEEVVVEGTPGLQVPADESTPLSLSLPKADDKPNP